MPAWLSDLMGQVAPVVMTPIGAACCRDRADCGRCSRVCRVWLIVNDCDGAQRAGRATRGCRYRRAFGIGAGDAIAA